MRLLLLCFLALVAAAAARTDYTGYQVLQTSALDELGLRRLAPLMERSELDFWSTPRVGRSVSIMAGPEHVAQLHRALQMMRLNPAVLIPDVQTTVDRERAEIESMRHAEKREGRAPALDRFLTFDEIQAYLDEVVATYPNIASIINIGNSYEGRPLRILKLSNGPGKSGMFIDSAVHAREWAGPPVVLFTINELTENLANNQAMLDANDFYFLPVANPDGYDYSWTSTRLWRKTRSPNAGSTCVGTDPNRNWDWDWAGGGVPSPCNDAYPGTAAFSEVEMSALADFFTANPSVTFYLSVHSYGQYLLHPWGNTNALPPDAPELAALATSAMDALTAVRGTVYEVGSIANVLYFAYGGSIDWTYGALDLKMSYAIELPAGGSAGFNPPASSIGPVTTETWEAIKVFAASIPASRA